jgi:hypothetical protein
MNPFIGHNGGPDVDGRKESLRTTWAKTLFADASTPTYVMAMAWAIHWYSRADGTGAALSNQQFEQMCGVSERTATRGKKWLRDNDYIELKVGNGDQKTQFRMSLPDKHRVDTQSTLGSQTDAPRVDRQSIPVDSKATLSSHTGDPGVATQATNNLYIESISIPDMGRSSGDGQSFWQHAFAEPSESVSFTNGKLTLLNGTRQRWLDEFGGDEKRLDLALIQIAPVIQPNSRRPLPAQVEAQLARIASEKRDRDTRYAQAAKANMSRGGSPWAKAKR